MNITIFCGANSGKNPIYAQKTKALATWMVDNKHSLVFGGGKVGLMGILADSLIAAGCETIGVMPTFLKEREIAHTGLSQLIVVEDMSSRKAKMMSLGQVFIALPGGPGTLEEISEVISWSRIGQNDKPCLLFNVNGYFEPLKKQFDHMVEEGFLSQEDRDKVLFTDDINEMEAFIQNYQAPQVRKY
ncbi:TIGR00730 family Rossman fold protein [Streptococcus sp. ZJ151]|uniref:LOG family protein n=1 Tax=Streptococcus jiangjianxini TaxID=3161189 RepID=UPI0032EC0021